MLQTRQTVLGLAATAVVGMGIADSARGDGEALMVIRSSPMSKWFSDPKDKGLAEAMGLLSTRIGEIPVEIRALADDRDVEEAMAAASTMMPVLLAFLDHPFEVAIIDHGNMVAAVPNLDIRCVIDAGSEQKARSMQHAVEMMMSMAGEDAEVLNWGNTGQKYVPLPMGQVMFGAVEGNARQFYIGVDLASDGMDFTPVSASAIAELGQGQLDWEMHVDGHAMASLIQRGLESTNEPDAQNMAAMIANMIPEGEFGLHGGGRIHDGVRKTVLRFEGGVPFATKLSELAQAFVGEIDVVPDSLNRDVLRYIPRDVNMMSAQVSDLTSAVGPINMMAYQYGIPEVAAVLNAIGQEWIWYTSDETGGGGMSSLVMIQPDVRGEDMSIALGELATALNAHATALHGYVRVRSWEGRVGGDAVPIHSVTFPGLPIPLEMSMSVVDGLVVAAASPQGLIAAVDHWRSGRPSVLDNANFRSAGRGLLDGASQITFVDLSRSVMRGYGAAQMLGSAMSNFVRSPSAPDRGLDLITPSPRELAKNVKPMIAVQRTEGDDYVYISTTDPSVLVNVAGTAGSSGMIPLLIGAGVAAAMIGQEEGFEMP